MTAGRLAPEPEAKLVRADVPSPVTGLTFHGRHAPAGLARGEPSAWSEDQTPMHLVRELHPAEPGRDLGAGQVAKAASSMHHRGHGCACHDGPERCCQFHAWSVPHHGRGLISRRSKRVMLAPVVPTASRPSAPNARSVTLNSSRPSNEIVNRSSSARRVSVCHSPDETRVPAPAICWRLPETTR